jgi:TonB family protein
VVKDSVPLEEKKPTPPVPDNKNKIDTSGTSTSPPGGGGTEDKGPFYGEGVNRLAIPPGGKGGSVQQIAIDWQNYVMDHLRYPPDAKRRGVQGSVIVSVAVAKDGTVTKVKILKSVSPELDKAALDMINAMPKWTPGVDDGWPVVVPYTLTLRFDPMNIK